MYSGYCFQENLALPILEKTWSWKTRSTLEPPKCNINQNSLLTIRLQKAFKIFFFLLSNVMEYKTKMLHSLSSWDQRPHKILSFHLCLSQKPRKRSKFEFKSCPNFCSYMVEWLCFHDCLSRCWPNWDTFCLNDFKDNQMLVKRYQNMESMKKLLFGLKETFLTNNLCLLKEKWKHNK